MSIPRPSIERLPRYYRAVILAAERGVETISSQAIARAVNVHVVQVRKDLAYFGAFGRPGVGYNVQYLVTELGRMLGIDKETRAVIVGAGHLGAAIANYHGLGRYQVNVLAMFDLDSEKIGSHSTSGVPVLGSETMEDFLAEHEVDLGIITVPHYAAQSVAENLVRCGIGALWNFAPITLHLPDEVIVRNEDLTTGLVTLCYYISIQGQENGEMDLLMD